MKIKAIDKLKIDTNIPVVITAIGGTQSGLYDLTRLTYNSTSEISTDAILEHIVEDHEAMRMDLICNSIYESVEHVDFLLEYNRILNPLNISPGQSIFYIDKDLIAKYEYDEIVDDTTNAIKKLVNTNKKQRIDKNREAAVNNPSLPPTLTDSLVDPVQIKGNQIVIGENLFR